MSAELFKPREYRLEDYQPYAEALERLEELRARRQTTYHELRARAVEAEREAARLRKEAIEADAADLQAGREPDPARWRAVEKAQEKAQRAREELAKLEQQAQGQAQALDLAIQRQEAEVTRLRSAAAAMVREQAWRDHEAVMRRIVRVVRELSELLREERAIYVGAERALDGRSGLWNWGVPDARFLLDPRKVEEWEGELRKRGYDIDDDEGEAVAAAS